MFIFVCIKFKFDCYPSSFSPWIQVPRIQILVPVIFRSPSTRELGPLPDIGKRESPTSIVGLQCLLRCLSPARICSSSWVLSLVTLSILMISQVFLSLVLELRDTIFIRPFVPVISSSDTVGKDSLDGFRNVTLYAFMIFERFSDLFKYVFRFMLSSCSLPYFCSLGYNHLRLFSFFKMSLTFFLFFLEEKK